MPQKFNAVIKRTVLVSLFVAVLSSCGANDDTYYSGDYELIPSAAKASLKSVTLEEILNFDCEPCYNFYTNGRNALQEKYGEQLHVVSVPVVFSQQTQFPVRMFIIAQKHGLGNKAISSIYHHRFQMKEDVFDEAVVLNIADSMGLKQEYLKHKDAEWVNEVYESNRAKAKRYQIRSTPTLVIEGQIKLVSNEMTNIQALINDLLI